MRRPRPRMSDRDPTPLESSLNHVYRRLGRPVILLTFPPKPDEGFGIEFATSGLTRAHIGAAALGLLRLLRDDMASDPCWECQSCTARMAHVEAAISVLEAPEAGGVTH